MITMSRVELEHFAPFTAQGHITNWPARIALVLMVIAVIAVAVWAMRAGWKARQRRQEHIPEPVRQAPEDFTALASAEGIYLGTSIHADWLDRVAVHGLGMRARASMSVGNMGFHFAMTGASDVFVTTESILSARVDSGVAGSVRSKESVIVVTWMLGDSTLDSGFRAYEAREQLALMRAIEALGIAMNVRTAR